MSGLHRSTRWDRMLGRCTAGSGAISIGACASCCCSAKSRPTAAATSCAPPRSRPIRCCAGSIWSTRSTSCTTAICSASAARPCCERARGRRRRCSTASRCLAATGSTICASRTSPTVVCSRSCTSRRRRRPAASTIYRDCVDDDPATRAIFEEILRDEVFHMNYTLHAARPRLAGVVPAPRVARARKPAVEALSARRGRPSPAFIGDAMLTGMYFVLLPPFAWLAKRAERRELPAGRPISGGRDDSPTSQY